MRLVHVFVSEEQKEAVFEVLQDCEVDYVTTTASSAATGGTLVEFPLPTDGVNDVLDSLREVGLDEESYVVVGSAETARTGTMERLQNRYASDFSPLATAELRSKSRDMSYDLYSFVWLVAVSAVIAAGGLLVDSPAVIVGSMVIAPLVGPVLTTGVGVVTDDRKMMSDSVQLQVVGLVVAIVTSAMFSLFLRVTGFAPAGLAISSIELVSVRLAPTLITVAIGLGAGSAAAFALTTKGPTALVGVMIAAALLPAAATVGIALVWGALIVALGSALLLTMTLIFINLAVIATLRYLGYQSDDHDSETDAGENHPSWTIPRFAAVALLVLVVTGVLAGTFIQLSFEREATTSVEEVIDRPAYDGLEVVAVRTQYDGRPFDSARTVSVTLSKSSNRTYPAVAADIQRQVASRTGEEPEVRVRFQEYQVASPNSRLAPD
ncbi:DUF389 domain-containing protein [Haladaptatus cibarius]|uniref:DUF389 domain-containing protein n=1 Tax=Haladaptatus cibarius TaxID=453847 RepID=UPI000678FE3B|nr:DUF389 domain-containing protein [Haladaptatus cibarius]